MLKWKDGVCGKVSMWLTHMGTCSPLKVLKSTFSSSFSWRFSRRGPCLLSRVGPHMEGHLWMEDKENSLRRFNHVFCPAEPTKMYPRGQPRDNSALHSKINSCKDPPPQAPFSWRVAGLKGSLPATKLCYASSLRSQGAKKLVPFFFSFCLLLPSLSLYWSSSDQS